MEEGVKFSVLTIVKIQFAIKTLVTARMDVRHISLGSNVISALMGFMVKVVIKNVLRIVSKGSVTKVTVIVQMDVGGILKGRNVKNV